MESDVNPDINQDNFSTAIVTHALATGTDTSEIMINQSFTKKETQRENAAVKGSLANDVKHLRRLYEENQRKLDQQTEIFQKKLIELTTDNDELKEKYTKEIESCTADLKSELQRKGEELEWITNEKAKEKNNNVLFMEKIKALEKQVEIFQKEITEKDSKLASMKGELLKNQNDFETNNDSSHLVTNVNTNRTSYQTSLCTHTECFSDEDQYKLECKPCKRLVHYKCSGLPPYQIQHFMTSSYRKYTCVNCTEVQPYLSEIFTTLETTSMNQSIANNKHLEEDNIALTSEVKKLRAELEKYKNSKKVEVRKDVKSTTVQTKNGINDAYEN